MSTTPQIDFEAIKAKVAAITPEERAKKLEAFRTRQLLQQKKQAAKGGQAAYNKKRMAEYKAMKEAAIADGTWDQIEASAKAQAETEFEKFIDAELDKEPSEETE